MSTPHGPPLDLIVAVPGPWPARSDLLTAVRRAQTGYLVAGRVIKEVATGKEHPIALGEPDPFLTVLVDTQGATAGLSPDEVSRARAHERLVTLRFSGDAPERVMGYAAALVRGGGYAVWIQTGGLIHAPEDWVQFAQVEPSPQLLVKALVGLFPSPDGGSYYSSGMHVLGLPDALVPGSFPPEQGMRLLKDFLLSAIEQPGDLRGGMAFQRGAGGPRLRLRHHPCGHFAAEDPQHNPYGLWWLTVD